MEKNTTSESPFESPFKAVGQGLGLDHFSDGLPYTPAAQAIRTRTIVERPQIHQIPQIPTTQATQTMQVMQAPVSEILNEARIESEVHSASVFSRVFAFAFDFSAATFIFFGVVWAGASLNEVSLVQLGNSVLDPRMGAGPGLLLAAFYLVLVGAYFLIQEVSGRTTLGKSIFGLYIKSNSSIAIGFRVFSFFIAVVPMGIGLFWALFDSKRRCWHDVITDTMVIKKK